ncbi:hypothetical protein [Bacillus andreraoultii]|uniref:hypothetical protein n=1 Tax=Bacillus andreraoultii TaxID=1499685 RepID=UPI00053A1CF9|nr:hypothetical protein [Bacillus andreraoultii]
MNEILKALPKTRVVYIGDEKVEIKKLPLGKYAELMLALKNIPSDVIKDLESIDAENEDMAIQAVFGLFGKAWGQVLDILSIGSGIDRERLENDPEIGLDVGVELFLAIYEVNNLESVVKNVKNLIKNRKTK